MNHRRYLSFPLIVSFLFMATPVFASTCEGLTALKLPDTTITAAEQVAAGALAPPAGLSAKVAQSLPAFCRVQATIKPAHDSDIKVEVWMPLSAWNGSYRGQGNGGFAGYVNYAGLATALTAGYASASTDTGHAGQPTEAGWALGHPDKIVDFGWRAVHEMTMKAKAIIEAFYGKPATHSYFAGCSNGGRQGLMEAQRFPEDYDGILVGAPANYWTRVFATFLSDIQATQSTPGSYIGAEKIPAIAKAVLAACDAKDDVEDGVLNDPRQCRFDPNTLICKKAESAECLTAAQAAALRKIYDGPVDAKGKQMYPGFLPGGEEGRGGWATWIGSAPGKDLQTAFATGFFTNMISAPEPVDPKTVQIESAVALADAQQGRTFNANNPDLGAFASRGGKLIMYHGWNDAALPPAGAVNYFLSVQEKMGGRETSGFMRLYMVPGMQHCAGGPGADSFGQGGGPGDAQHNAETALEQWVEKGAAPDKIIAAKYANDTDPSPVVKMTRPLCPYPQYANYKGKGDTNSADSFECAALPNNLIYTVDSTITPPHEIYTPDPSYTKAARDHRVQGNVKLSVVIGKDGRTRDVKVTQSLEPSLDAQAVDAVKKWKFVPGSRNGQPVAVQVTVEVAFRLSQR